MADFPKMLDEYRGHVVLREAATCGADRERAIDAAIAQRSRMETYVSLLEAVETAARNYFMGKGGAFAVFDALQALDVWKKENGHA